jgi:hypothetical protein
MAKAHRDFGLLPIPKKLRYQPEAAAHFGWVLNAVFALTAAFTGALHH